MSELLRKVDVPEGRNGLWRVERFTVSPQDAAFENLRASIGSSARPIAAGDYTRLLYGMLTTVMSDTPMEFHDHAGIVRVATGRILLAGLGLGVVLQALLDKPEVEHVTVIESAPEVIALVAPHYLDRYGKDRLTLVRADVRTWRPTRDERWDYAWFDIWDNICGDNAAEMRKLKRRFKSRVGWWGCWAYYETQRAARRW